MIKIKVPATTTNLGPGFDCLGLALNIYNIIEVEEIDKGLEIHVPEVHKPYIPLDETNLVYQSMQKVFDKADYKVKGIRIKLNSNIPFTRGLGSSAACIVGGLVAANQLAGNPFNNKEIACMAVEMDGHPDNVMPALVGGLVIACMEGKQVFHIRMDPPENIKLALMIPDFHLPTTKAREALPTKLSFSDAAFNIGRTAFLAAALLTGQLDYLQVAMEDRIHQPYRKEFIPHWDEIFKEATNLGAKGFFLSGAGPTLIAVLDANNMEFDYKMKDLLIQFHENWEIHMTVPCKEGVKIFPG